MSTQVVSVESPLSTNLPFRNDNSPLSGQYRCAPFITGLTNDSLPVCAEDGQSMTSVDLSTVSLSNATMKVEDTGLTTYQCDGGFINEYGFTRTGEVDFVNCIKSPNGTMVGGNPGFKVIVPGQICPNIWSGEIQNVSPSAVTQLFINSTTGAIAYAMCEAPPTPDRSYIDYDCSQRGLITALSSKRDPFVECNGMDMSGGSNVIRSRPQDEAGESSIQSLFCMDGVFSKISLSSLGSFSQATCVGSEQSPLLVKDSYTSANVSQDIISCSVAQNDESKGKFWALAKIFVNQTGFIQAALCAEIDPAKISYPLIGQLPDVSGPLPELPGDSNQVNYGRTVSSYLLNKDLQDINGINQGGWGNCWFLSSMTAVAYRCPATYVAKKKDNWTPRGIWSTCDITLYDPQLQPKVYSKSCSGWYDHLSSPDLGWYPKWAGVFLTAAQDHFQPEGISLRNGNNPWFALRALTGQKYGFIPTNEVPSFALIGDALAANPQICGATVAGTYNDAGFYSGTNLAENHAYALLDWRDGMFILSNPWGSTNSKQVNVPGAQTIGQDNVFAIPESQFRKFFYSIFVACDLVPPSITLQACQ
ncbi:hypothetical protein MIR68_009455 [Amoeboaphelidium protococcarum]|nr:hypothetical protein MIR68_009455 [Amoeboaphelidium protococcarum]